MSDEQRKLATALTDSPRGEVRGPYVPLLYSPELADRMRHLGDFIRFGGIIPARTKELMVLLCAAHYRVDYIFAVHREFSRREGIDASVADTIAAGDRPEGLDTAEAAAYDLALELLETTAVSDTVFARARACFGEGGVVELVSFVGYYTTLAMLISCARLPVPEGGVGLDKVGG